MSDAEASSVAGRGMVDMVGMVGLVLVVLVMLHELLLVLVLLLLLLVKPELLMQLPLTRSQATTRK